MKKHKDSLKNYVLEWCETKEELNDAEVDWIKNFREECGKRCLNIANGGDGGVTYVCKFRSEETKKKMSEAMKGRAPWNKGKTHVYSEEVNRKRSETLKGHGVSEETRKKISEAKKGCISPMKGLHRSEETKKKISETLKNKAQKKLSRSIEQINNIIIWQKRNQEVQ